MRRTRFMLSATAIVVSMWRTSCDGAEPRAVDPSQALGQLEDAIDALEPWRTALEAGAPFPEAEQRRLHAAMNRLYRGFVPLVERAHDERTRQLQAENARRMSHREQAQAWVEAMRQLGPAAAESRTATAATLLQAVQGDDPDLRLAALEAIGQLGDVDYDKAAFRPLILPIIADEEDGPTLVSACYALYNTDRRPDDLTLIQSAWGRRTPLVDDAMSHLLFLFGDGKIAGRSEQIVLELLDSPEDQVRREALRGLWGAAASDRLAARIIELADDSESRHDAIYFGLSTFKPKNEAVVDKLIETLADADFNDWGRALWGLGFGVPEELQGKVAAALADMYAARSDPRTRQQCRDLIVRYAGAEAAEQLPK